MATRREVLGLFGSVSIGGFLARSNLAASGHSRMAVPQSESIPPLAAGAPLSAERTALIEAFRKSAEGVDQQFEAGGPGDQVMPYRLFRPKASGTLPLVVYLHGSGGLGSDNQKQMGAGNVFGTRVWALPENQRRFPCFVVAPQTDRGWIRYGDASPGDSIATVVPGLGDGARMAFALIDALIRELPIDARRVYLTGQSMGGAGAWHMLAQRSDLFAAAAICCGSRSIDAVEGIRTPVWNFHGEADDVVPLAASRDRIAALRKAGARPISTEYAGVGHNVWQWAYTEPSLISWLFSKRR